MVLVKREVPAESIIDGSYSPSSSSSSAVAGGSSLPMRTQLPPLPQEAYESTFQATVPKTKVEHFCAAPFDNQMKMWVLEYMNRKRAVAQGRDVSVFAPHIPSTDEEMRKILLEYQQSHLISFAERSVQLEQKEADARSEEDSRQGYHMQTMQLDQENRRRLSQARQPSGYAVLGDRSALQDYQTQKRLLELQNKERLMLARQGNMSDHYPVDNAQSTRHSGAYDGRATYSTSFGQTITGFSADPMSAWLRKGAMTTEERSNERREDAEMMVMIAEQQEKKKSYMSQHAQGEASKQEEPAPKVTTANHALQDDQIQLMANERANKEKLRKAREEQDDMSAAGPRDHRSQPAMNSAALQDYQMQLMLKEHANKKRLMVARPEQDDLLAVGLSVEEGQDHQMVLKLLEQQNRKRLRMVREDQDRAAKHHCTSSSGAHQVHIPQIQQMHQDDYCMYPSPVPCLAPGTYSLLNGSRMSGPSTFPAEDKWGKGPVRISEGVLQDYQIQLMAHKNREAEAAAARSQTSVEFSEQRQRYQSELAAAQSVPSTPGTVFTPPETPAASSTGADGCCEPRANMARASEARPLELRPAPGRGAGFDDLYDN